jgi:hypothetical protein
MRSRFAPVAVVVAITSLGTGAARASPGASDAPAGAGAQHQHHRAALQRTAEPLHVRVARAVFPRDRWQKLIRDSSEELTKQIAEQGKGRVRLAPEFAERLRQEYEEMVPYEEMVGYQADILGSHYNRTELRHMLTFYTSAVGKKAVRIIPALMGDSLVRAQAKVHERLPEALERLRPLVQNLPNGGAPGEASGAGPEDHSEGGLGQGQSAPSDEQPGTERQRVTL